MEIYMDFIYRARGGTQKHADNERMTNCRHWQKAHSSGPSLQSGFAVSAHRAADGREKRKTEETKGIITMFKSFPHHLTSIAKEEANFRRVKCLFESQGFSSANYTRVRDINNGWLMAKCRSLEPLYNIIYTYSLINTFSSWFYPNRII